MFAFSPFLTGFTAKVSLSWAKNELTRILPFFQKCDEILFSSVFLLFSSFCCFLLKRDQKRGEFESRKNSVLFFDTSFTRKRKGRKNSSHYEGRSAFSESALNVFFFSRGRFVLSRVKSFFLFLLLFFYIANSSIL